MKALLSLLIIILAGCTPVKYVNVERKHNFYQRHRYNTYTVPVWVPGRGVILETHIYRQPKNWVDKKHARRKN